MCEHKLTDVLSRILIADFPEGYAEEAIAGLGLSEGPMTEIRAKLVVLYHRSKTAAAAKEAEEEAKAKAAAEAAEAGKVAEEEAIKDSLCEQMKSLENLLKSDGGNVTSRNQLVRLHYQLGGHLASLETK